MGLPSRVFIKIVLRLQANTKRCLEIIDFPGAVRGQRTWSSSTNIRRAKSDMNCTYFFVGHPHSIVRFSHVGTRSSVHIAWLLNYLFETVLDGRREYVCDGVQRALGREPDYLGDFTRRTVARGIWNKSDDVAAA